MIKSLIKSVKSLWCSKMINIPFNKEKSHYLLVGVGKRKEDSEAMAVSAEDAQFLQRALHAFDLFSGNGFPPLVNEKATREEILDHLDALAYKTKDEPADLVIIFFSGHGSVAGGKYYLICRDTKVGAVEDTAIEGSQFVEKLDQIQCDKMLVLLDCCHAEGITDEPVPFDDASRKILLEKRNRVILTACARKQVSYLSRPVSIFTYALIEGLGGKFLNDGDKEVTIFNLAMGVRERVVALSAKALKIKKPQQPQLNVLRDSATTNFALAYYPTGGQMKLKVLKEELTSLKTDDGKDFINTEVIRDTDTAYRNEFKWLVTNNTIQDIGNGNYIVQGVNGENITVNSGMSGDQLKDILSYIQARDKSRDELLREFIALLKVKNDNESAGLLIKVKEVKSATEREIKILQENLNELLNILQALSKEHIYAYDIKKKMALKKEIDQTNREIAEVKSQLSKLR